MHNLAVFMTVATMLLPSHHHPKGREVVRDINHVRRQHGMAPLRYSRTISLKARGWSRHLRKLGYLEHAKGLRGRWSKRGEVLAAGYSDPVQPWLDSPPHRKIILSHWGRYIGMGRAGKVWTGRVTAP